MPDGASRTLWHRKNEVVESITIKWTNGNENKYEIKDLNKVYEFKQPI